MTITVQVAPESAREFHRLASDLNVSFRPLHPGTDDAVLRSYLVADVTDPDEAARVVGRLRQSPIVQAAYVKPPEAMA